MYVCMYVSIQTYEYANIHIYKPTNIQIYKYTNIYMHLYIHTYIHTYMHTYIFSPGPQQYCTFIYFYVCIFVDLYIGIFVYLHVYVCAIGCKCVYYTRSDTEYFDPRTPREILPGFLYLKSDMLKIGFDRIFLLLRNPALLRQFPGMQMSRAYACAYV